DVGTRIVRGMTVHAEQMARNLELTSGAIYSQRALTALVESGMERDAAYRIVQESAQRAWEDGTSFRDLLAERLAAGRAESGGGAGETIGIELHAGLDPGPYLGHVPAVLDRLAVLRSQP